MRSFSPRPSVQIVGVNTLRWQTVKAKISASSRAELIRPTIPPPCPKSSPPPLKSFPGLSPLFFPYFPHFFLPRLLTNQLKTKKLQKIKNALTKFLEWNLDF